jgi:hypothetical protein
MARSATFKWSSLTRDNLVQMLKTCAPYLVNQRLHVKDIQKIFSSHIKSFLPIKVIKDKDWNTEPGFIYIGGFYYGASDMKGHQAIAVLLSYHPLDEYLTLTRSKFDRMCYTIADTILHEIIHMRQLRSRGWKNIPGFQSYAESNKQRKQQNYYGDPDEIDAHAFNIACSLYSRFGSEKAIAKYINKDFTDGRLKKDVFKSYMKAFDYQHSHPVIKKLKKRVMYYVPYAEIGKPYKTNDWLKR